MEKPVPTNIEIHPLLKRRWSPRAFAGKTIENETLLRIFEAARWAPSSGNEQPWRFIIGIKNKDETWQRIFDCLDDGNRKWCVFAPVLLIAVASKNFERNGKANKHFSYDLGQALAHLTFQAMQENVFTHQMAGFYPETVSKNFNIGDDYEPFTCAALGYLAVPEILPEDLAKREYTERKRKEISDIVYTDWQKPFLF